MKHRNSSKLDSLSARIEKLSSSPEQLSSTLGRIMGLVLSRFGWAPKIRFEKAPRLLGLLSKVPSTTNQDTQELEESVEEAILELDENVTAIERLTVIQQRVLYSHATWLRRIHSAIEKSCLLLEKQLPRSEEFLLRTNNEYTCIPPVGLRSLDPKDQPSILEPFEAELLDKPNTNDKRTVTPVVSPLVSLQLSVVDHLVQAARSEGEYLKRKRRMFEGARRALLDISASMPTDPRDIQIRQRYIAKEIAQIDRVEGAGLSSGVRVLHQVRQAMLHGESDKVSVGLFSLQHNAIAKQDVAVAELASQALDKLWKQQARWDDTVVESSYMESIEQILNPAAINAILKGYELAREPGRFVTQWEEIRQRAQNYLLPGAELETFRALLAVDGCCEVGGTLSPVRIEEIIQRHIAVRHPTQDLMLVTAESAEDIPDAIIEDPRTILLSLATGRLLTRRFVQIEQRRNKRNILQGEVRVFLLDGSGSMIGTRGRVRDAILLAELASLAKRASEHGRISRVTLYFRYFSDALGPVTKVTTPKSAVEAMEQVVATIHQGHTNLEAALLACYQQIIEARHIDPDLSRAQLVLITDGEAPIDMEKIRFARQSIQGLPIGISVITLGEENTILKQLVAEQRAAGEQAFYHYLPDSLLKDMVEGQLTERTALHLPAEMLAGKSAAQQAAEMEESLGPLLDELASVEHERDLEAMELATYYGEALKETGAESLLVESEKARIDQLTQDFRGLCTRFEQWFPAIPRPSADVGIQDQAASQLLDQIIIILGAVVDICELGDSVVARQVDAIEILERLLPEAQISPATYLTTLQQYACSLGPAIESVRSAVYRNQT